MRRAPRRQPSAFRASEVGLRRIFYRSGRIARNAKIAKIAEIVSSPKLFSHDMQFNFGFFGNDEFWHFLPTLQSGEALS
jgi:hypothetical protein